jgi:hypothetical protein
MGRNRVARRVLGIAPAAQMLQRAIDGMVAPSHARALVRSNLPLWSSGSNGIKLRWYSRGKLQQRWRRTPDHSILTCGLLGASMDWRSVNQG